MFIGFEGKVSMHKDLPGAEEHVRARALAMFLMGQAVRASPLLRFGPSDILYAYLSATTMLCAYMEKSDDDRLEVLTRTFEGYLQAIREQTPDEIASFWESQREDMQTCMEAASAALTPQHLSHIELDELMEAESLGNA